MSISGLHHFNLRIPESEMQAVQIFYVEAIGLRLSPPTWVPFAWHMAIRGRPAGRAFDTDE